MSKSPDSFMFTVGKLDAGMAILLGERAHLIEFPSILLPPGATAGSIVNISVNRNLAEEKRRDQDFWDLQREIYETFGVDTPKAPELQLRNVTQTSVTLEWPQVHLATAKLRSLDIYRNGQRLAAIPQPVHNTSTKLSGLQLDTDYNFQLILRTTAGTFPSNVIRVRTHTMTDTSGISVCFGTIQDPAMLEEAKSALREMRAKWSDKIQIDTTHFVCTTPAGPGNSAGPGVEYQRALQLSIPVVQPQWIFSCHRERKMMPIAHFYLGAASNAAMAPAPFQRPQSMSQVSLQRAPQSNPSSPPAHTTGPSNRASMPPPRRQPPNGDISTDADTSSFVNQHSSQSPKPAPVPEESEAEEEARSPTSRRSPLSATARRQRNGTMDRNFKFPPPTSESSTEAPPPVPALPKDATVGSPKAGSEGAPQSPTNVPMEVPPPDPVEKERERVDSSEADDDIGATEEISLN